MPHESATGQSFHRLGVKLGSTRWRYLPRPRRWRWDWLRLIFAEIRLCQLPAELKNPVLGGEDLAAHPNMLEAKA